MTDMYYCNHCKHWSVEIEDIKAPGNWYTWCRNCRVPHHIEDVIYSSEQQIKRINGENAATGSVN